jgi:hypothetical protein
MSAFAFRRALSALILVGAAFAAVQAAEYQELAPRPRMQFACDLGGCMGMTPSEYRKAFFMNVTPWWATATVVAIVVVGLLLSAVVYPRRAAWSPESWMRGVWSARVLRNHV